MKAVNRGPASTGDILIVDDTPSDLKLLSDILKKAGYTVRAASDGELALRSVQARLPALILLDIKMPAPDGYEVCRRLKDSEDTMGIPVVFISVETDPMKKVKAFGLGGVDYITKPFESEEVLARVATHLARWKAQKENEKRNLQLQQQIAERKRAEKALRKSEEKYRILMMQIRDGIYTLDTEGRFTFVNDVITQRSGQPREWFLGRNYLDVIRPEERDRVKGYFDRIMLGEDVPIYELAYATSSGEQLWVEVNTSALRKDHRIVGVHRVSRDINDSKQAK